MDNRASDRSAGLFCIIVTAVFYWQGRGLSAESVLLPLVLEVFLLIMGLYLVGRSFIIASEEMEDEHLTYSRSWVMIAATIVYLVAIELIGFYISTGVFLIVISWFFNDHGYTYRSLLTSVLYGLIVTASIYATFSMFLQVPTPEGLFF